MIMVIITTITIMIIIKTITTIRLMESTAVYVPLKVSSELPECPVFSSW